MLHGALCDCHDVCDNLPDCFAFDDTHACGELYGFGGMCYDRLNVPGDGTISFAMTQLYSMGNVPCAQSSKSNSVICFTYCNTVRSGSVIPPGPPEIFCPTKGERSPLSVSRGAGAHRTSGNWAPNKAPNSVQHNSVFSGLTVSNESG